MSYRTAPCGWEPDAPCAAGPCCPTSDDPDVAAKAERIAAALIWRLTGMAYGCCEITVRPCKPETCAPQTLTDLIYWNARPNAATGGNMGVLSFTPTLVSGQAYNIACGCPQGCCKCKADCEVPLPGPVCAITEVKIGASVVPAENYTLYNHNRLVFLAGQDCPPCQDYNKPLGQEGTWSVKYTIGRPVPEELNFAAGLYACELAKLLAGQPCSLPTHVKSIARQGIVEEFWDPTELAIRGLTGLPAVDAIIKAINPHNNRQAPRVWTPGLAKRWRRETS